MTFLTKMFNKFESVLLVISMLTLFIMMLWVFTDVFLRFFFNAPLKGTIEITGEYLMVLIVYLAISSTQKHDGHIKVTLFSDKFPKKIENIIKFITNLVAAFIFLWVSYFNFQKGGDYLNNSITSVGSLDYPLAPALFIIGFGILMISIRLIFESVIILKKLW